MIGELAEHVDLSASTLGPAPEQNQERVGESPDVRALGWGVELPVNPPSMVAEQAVVLDPSSPKVLFKEGPWVGQWAGYIFTTIEHGGRPACGYKLDTASEPTDTFHGPRPGKYFGLNGVLGYHHDGNGPPPGKDPSSDRDLADLGWGPALAIPRHQAEHAGQEPTAMPESPIGEAKMEKDAEQLPINKQAFELTAKAVAMHNKIQRAEKAFEVKEEKKGVTRRAAYNLLMRLKENNKRHKSYSEEMISQLLSEGSHPFGGPIVGAGERFGCLVSDVLCDPGEGQL